MKRDYSQTMNHFKDGRKKSVKRDISETKMRTMSIGVGPEPLHIGSSQYLPPPDTNCGSPGATKKSLVDA